MPVGKNRFPLLDVWGGPKERGRQIGAAFGERMHVTAEGGLNKVAKKVLAEACSAYADASKADKVTRVMGQVDEVKDLVQDSISELMATRENLEVRPRGRSLGAPADAAARALRFDRASMMYV